MRGRKLYSLILHEMNCILVYVKDDQEPKKSYLFLLFGKDSILHQDKKGKKGINTLIIRSSYMFNLHLRIVSLINMEKYLLFQSV